MQSEWRCLVPFDPAEAISLKEAAVRAGRTANTICNWCEAYGIGRRIAGRWHVSRIALAMFLDGDQAALDAYHAGRHAEPSVAAYFVRLQSSQIPQ